jgi:Meiotically up-regulated gene 113
MNKPQTALKCVRCRKPVPAIRLHLKLNTCSDECQLQPPIKKRRTGDADKITQALRSNKVKSAPLRVKSTGSRTVSDFLYLFYAPATAQYKIGISAVVSKRAMTIQNTAGISVEIVDAWELGDSAAQNETYIHQKLAKYRTFGEWFDFGDAEQEEVRCMVERLLNGHDL